IAVRGLSVVCCIPSAALSTLARTGERAQVLKIAICLKQIPLIEDANFDPVTKTIKRDGPNVISAFDLRAISLEMELKNRLSGAAQITGVRKLEIEGRRIHAERESDEGFDEIEAELPAVLTCAERVAQPIKVKPDAIEKAKTKRVETVTAADIGEPAVFGFA